MSLNITAAPIFLQMQADRQYVIFNQSTIKSSLQVYSVRNSATRLPIIQSNVAAQPRWSQNGVVGTYTSRNSGGATIAGAGIPGFLFLSGQYFEYDALSTQYSGVEQGLTITSTVMCSTPNSGSAQVIWGLGSGSATPQLYLKCQSGSVTFTEVSSAGTTSVSAAIDTNAHVITCVRTNNSLQLKIDAATVGTTAITTAVSSTYTTFCIGALNSNGSVGSFFNGAIDTLVAYGGAPGVAGGGAADISTTEVALMAKTGVSRPTQVTTTTAKK